MAGATKLDLMSPGGVAGSSDRATAGVEAEDGAAGQPACLGGGGCTLLRGEITTARLIPRKTN